MATRDRAPAVAVLVAAAVVTGCAVTVPGKPVAADTLGPPPPALAAGDLDGLLLNEAEINAAMGATDMTVLEKSNQMWDSSGEVSNIECLGAYGAAEYKVYTGSGFSAVRYLSMQEPAEEAPHFAEQAVVSFSNHDGAAKFYADSAENWGRCANGRFSFKLPEWPAEAMWTVGQVSDTDGMLKTSMLMEDGDGWGCGRALTAGNNVVIDVSTCSYNNETGDTAVTIAQDIADKLPKG
jgi:PknH-like extracellular domain